MSSRHLTRTAVALAIALSATAALAGCTTVRYPDTAHATAPAQQQVINGEDNIPTPTTQVFWQDIGDGHKVRCIWAEGDGTGLAGLSCDWASPQKE